MKAKMDEMKKMILVYTIELLVFAVAFLVIAILEFTRVLTISETHLRIINWVTIFGAPLGLLDFVWFYFSPIRRKKNSFLDKILIVPLAIYILVFDIICFVNYDNPQVELAQLMIPIALSYVAVIYSIEAAYHYKHPVPMLLMELEKEKQEQADVIDIPVEESNDNKEDND